MQNLCSCVFEGKGFKGTRTARWVRFGSYYRKSDSHWILRWRCSGCGRTISSATGQSTFGQKRRRLNEPLFRLLCSGVSLRRAALVLGCNPKTVTRKFKFLADKKRLENLSYIKDLPRQTEVFFDEMETHEHSKWKPVSIALAVNAERKVLGFRVCSMPARGSDAHRARQKYGPRKDDRKNSLHSLFIELKPKVSSGAFFYSDEKTLYPSVLKSHFKDFTHCTYKGRRGCVAGQGELKRGGFDPLFPLNHTAAMLRANMNRLFRRTWCTTKKLDRLKDHIELYIAFHNQFLTPTSTP